MQIQHNNIDDPVHQYHLCIQYTRITMLLLSLMITYYLKNIIFYNIVIVVHAPIVI